MWLGHCPCEGLWGTTADLDKVAAWLRLIPTPNTFHCHGAPPLLSGAQGKVACSGGPPLRPHMQWPEPASSLHLHPQRGPSYPTPSPQALPTAPEPCIHTHTHKVHTSHTRHITHMHMQSAHGIHIHTTNTPQITCKATHTQTLHTTDTKHNYRHTGYFPPICTLSNNTLRNERGHWDLRELAPLPTVSFPVSLAAFGKLTQAFVLI